MIPVLFRRRAAAAALACAGFFLIGWSSLLVPSLVRQVQDGFGQDDAGLGAFYLANSAAYAVGSLLGGIGTERFGRRAVLVLAGILHGVGLLLQGLVGSWTVFLLAGIPRGLGSGAIDGGMNALVLDLYPESRGRALNAAHLFFSLGALAAPFAVAATTGSTLPWQELLTVTGLASFPVAILLMVTAFPAGRREPAPVPAVSGATVARGDRLGLRALGVPILALAAAIAFYVMTEMGVSNWLVRFLEAAPVAVATSALGLYWAGLTVGRLVSARYADRFDHLTLAIVAAGATSVALAAAVVVPSIPVSIALFTLVGFAQGPIFPLIMAIGGERHPDRTATVSGLLTTAAIVGSIVYPPAMGLLSVTIGLPAAMFGTAILGVGSVVALLAVGRLPARRPAAA